MRNPRVTQILSAIADEQQDSLPARLCEACLSALSISGVGLALMNADGPSGVVLVATDGPAAQLEELQFALNEGPCVDASRSGRPVLQPDLAATGPARWPRFVAAMGAAGVGAVFAFPLGVGAIRIGVLDLYRDIPGHLTGLELTDALAFADAATVVLLHLQDRSDHDGEHPGLTGPIEDRAQVHQATGMISVQLGVTLAGALLRLRAHAYATERKVSDVAADVVGRRLRFDDKAPGSTTEDRQ